jgi:hypothetical protein
VPRLTDSAYLKKRNLLVKSWRDAPCSRLDAMDQYALHRYFAPTKDLSDREALERRRAVTAKLPSLPQEAGKAWACFEAARAAPAPVHVAVPYGRRRGKNQDFEVRVSAVLRPDVDFKRLARVLLDIVREREQNKHVGTGPHSGRRPRGRS